MILKILSRLSFIFILTSCAPPAQDYNPHDLQRLDRLRVLGFTQDMEEYQIGDVMKLSPIASDYNGNGRSISWSINYCYNLCEGDVLTNGGSGILTGLNAPTYSGLANPIEFQIKPNDGLDVGFLHIYFSYTAPNEPTRVVRKTIKYNYFKTVPHSKKVTGITTYDGKALKASPKSSVFLHVDASDSTNGDSEVFWVASHGHFSSEKSNIRDYIEYVPEPISDSAKPTVLMAIITDRIKNIQFLSMENLSP